MDIDFLPPTSPKCVDKIAITLELYRKPNEVFESKRKLKIFSGIQKVNEVTSHTYLWKENRMIKFIKKKNEHGRKKIQEEAMNEEIGKIRKRLKLHSRTRTFMHTPLCIEIK